MKKIGKMVLMMMLAIPLLGTNVTAATTENPDGRAVMNPCDDILQPGEYAQFSPRNSGMTSYRVDKVDAAKDLIYNNNLKAWLPAWSLIEVYQSSVGGTGSLVYECRKLIGKLFNFDNPKKVIFTSNVTDSLNIAMRGILKENDHVITSSLEHNAVWRCLKTLERDINIKIDTVECSKDGITNPQDIKKYIKKDTALIVFTQASNVLGTIQPIREIGAIAREHNIPFLVDSAQSAGAMKIDVKEDNIDILAFTGHKSLLGPMGTGGLIINTNIDIKPLKAGGTGGDSAYEYQPDYYPNHLETGTSNVSGIAGLREAIKFLNKEGIENIHNNE